ncbi:MAG: hypothetical protein ACOYN3_08030, partial [Acidimicrobiia bacterium]
MVSRYRILLCAALVAFAATPGIVVAPRLGAAIAQPRLSWTPPSNTPPLGLTFPGVGIAATPAGAGHWLVASDGGIF